MPGSEYVQSLLKAMDIMLCIAESEDGLHLSELEAKLGINKKTIHSLLRTLAVRGFVRKNSNNCFLLGDVIPDLYFSRFYCGIMTAAENEIRRIGVTFPDSVVTFVELVDRVAYLRLRLSPERHGIVSHPRRQRLDLCSSASGCLLLALASNRELFLSNANFNFSLPAQNHWHTREKMIKHFPEWERERCCAFTRLNHDDLAAVSVTDSFALGVKSRTGVFNRDDVLSLLRESAKRIMAEIARPVSGNDSDFHFGYPCS